VTAPELIPPGRLTRRELAQRITERWRAGCDAMLSTIFAVGRDLPVLAFDAFRLRRPCLRKTGLPRLDTNRDSARPFAQGK
jgi:hypothetical protein